MSRDYQKEIITRLRILALTVQCVIYFPIISVRQIGATLTQQTRRIHTKLCWSITSRKSAIVSKPSFLLWHWLWKKKNQEYKGKTTSKNQKILHQPSWNCRALMVFHFITHLSAERPTSGTYLLLSLTVTFWKISDNTGGILGN